MATTTAVLWNLDATDEEVINESIGWYPDTFLAGEPESVLKLDLRKRVEKCHYAPGGKYHGELWTVYMEVISNG